MSRQTDPAQLDMFAAISAAPATPAPTSPGTVVPPLPPPGLPLPIVEEDDEDEAPVKAPPAEKRPEVVNAPQAAAPRPAQQQPARHGAKGGRHPQRPLRRRMAMAKATVMSPEARRAAEERDRRMIEEFIAQGKVTKGEARWAVGSVPMAMFGTEI